VLQTWSGFPPQYEVAVDFRGGLGERTSDLGSLENLLRDEFREVDDVTITIEPSRDAWHDHLVTDGSGELTRPYTSAGIDVVAV
jgi:hypothetical protein